MSSDPALCSIWYAATRVHVTLRSFVKLAIAALAISCGGGRPSKTCEARPRPLMGMGFFCSLSGGTEDQGICYRDEQTCIAEAEELSGGRGFPMTECGFVPLADCFDGAERGCELSSEYCYPSNSWCEEMRNWFSGEGRELQIEPLGECEERE